MKKILLLLIFAFTTASCVNYYNVTVHADTILYSTQNDESSSIYTVSSGSSVYIKGKKNKKYRKIKYENYIGWAYYPPLARASRS